MCPESVDPHNSLGFTQLNQACWVGDLDEAQSLLEAGADPNSCNGISFYTPLHSSSFKGHLAIVKLLIKFGADINAQEAKGYTPLNSAIWNDHQDVALFLINNNADLAICSNDGFSPLNTAVWVGNLVVVRNLVEKGADVNFANVDGFTPLHAAAKKGHLEIAGFLVKNGARLDALDRWGRDVIKVAEDNQNWHLVKFFEYLVNNH